MKIECRKSCGACCIAPSISSPLPLLPKGKAAGLACPHLDAAYNCTIFESEERPKVCASLSPSLEMCGCNRDEAISYLNELELTTCPLKA